MYKRNRVHPSASVWDKSDNVLQKRKNERIDMWLVYKNYLNTNYNKTTPESKSFHYQQQLTHYCYIGD